MTASSSLDRNRERSLGEVMDRRRVVTAYAVGAALHAGIVTALELGADPARQLLVVWFVTWWTNLWPLIPTPRIR